VRRIRAKREIRSLMKRRVGRVGETCVAPDKAGRGREPLSHDSYPPFTAAPRPDLAGACLRTRLAFAHSRLARAIGKLVAMGEAGRSQVGRRRWADLAAGSRVCCRHGAESHTHTGPQTSTRLSPGVAGGWRLFMVARRSRNFAPVSRLEPHRYQSNEGHPPAKVC
jgi:hypothetical protein